MNAFTEDTSIEPYRVLGGWAHVYGRPLFGGDERDLGDLLGALSQTQRVVRVSTPNVDQILQARTDPAARAALVEADVLLADGAPLVLLAGLLGAPRPQRLTGADLLPTAAALSARDGLRVAILGGAAGVSERAVAVLSAAHPDAHLYTVPFPPAAECTPATDAAAVEALEAIGAEIVFVCLGFPRQETWVGDHRRTLPPAVYIGAGAAVDFAAGTRRRAPRFLQRLGLEWAFRLAQEPIRLAHRYLVRGPGFLEVAWRAWRASLRGRALT